MLLALKKHIILMSVIFLCFVLLSCIVVFQADAITSLDMKILIKIQNMFAFLPVQIPIFISDFGYEWFMLPQFAILSYFMIKVKQWKELLGYFLITEGVYFAVLITKNIIARPRPDEIYRKVVKTSFSFPSGHSSVNMFFYLALILILSRFIKNDKLRIFVNILCICWIFAVGFSRIFLGVHYPSDVLGGYLLGIFAFSVFSLYLNLCKKKAANENPTGQEF